jgi:hypothetical protein
MLKRKCFLRWLLAVTAAVNVGGFAGKIGLYGAVFSTPASVIICSLILVLLVIATLKLGKDSWKLSTFECSSTFSLKTLTENVPQDLATIDNDATIGPFIGTLCVSLGVLGTICGIIIMFSGFGGLVLGDPTSATVLLKAVTEGFGTALYTTLIGLIAAILLSIQSFNIAHASQKIKNRLSA